MNTSSTVLLMRAAVWTLAASVDEDPLLVSVELCSGVHSVSH